MGYGRTLLQVGVGVRVQGVGFWGWGSSGDTPGWLGQERA